MSIPRVSVAVVLVAAASAASVVAWQNGEKKHATSPPTAIPVRCWVNSCSFHVYVRDTSVTIDAVAKHAERFMITDVVVGCLPNDDQMVELRQAGDTVLVTGCTTPVLNLRSGIPILADAPLEIRPLRPQKGGPVYVTVTGYLELPDVER